MCGSLDTTTVKPIEMFCFLSLLLVVVDHG